MSKPYREKCLSQKINVCWVCGTSEGLEVHHIDGDRSNNELENLTPLCESCHKLVHYIGNQDEVTGGIDDLRKELPVTKRGSIKEEKTIDVTSFQCGTDTREMLAEYRDNNGFSNYDQALKSLLQHAEE
jgi:hypothetical protein